jgi:hypothetical protein
MFWSPKVILLELSSCCSGVLLVSKSSKKNCLLQPNRLVLGETITTACFPAAGFGQNWQHVMVDFVVVQLVRKFAWT